jgi:cytochrome P450
MTFSRPFGFLDAQQDDGIFTKINASVRSGTWLAHVPWILHMHNFFMPVIGNWLAANDRDGTVRDYTIREVQNRFERGSDRPDILGRLFEINKEKPQVMDMTNITSVASANVGAGSDTTAISLRAILYFLLKNPDKKEKLLEEIHAMSHNVDSSGIPTFDQASKMPYLQAVMYEAMRLYPAIGMILSRVTPGEGFMIGEQFIPGGVSYGCPASPGNMMLISIS